MVCDSVRSCVTTSTAAANRPTDLIFGMYMDIGDQMPIFDKSRSKVRGQCQKFTLWLARCQIWKKSQTEASRDSAVRGVPFHVYYLHFGQYAHPMGSGRPQWAAGEFPMS